MILVSCQNKKLISFDMLSFSNEKDIDAPLVIINVPKATNDNKVSKVINNTIEERIIALLIFPEDVKVNNINEAIKSFKTEFYDVKEKFEDHSARWEAKVNGEILFENNTILTIVLKSYVYTGGAHGYESTSFLNFDKEKGKYITNEELFIDNDAFLELANIKFRKQEKIPLDVPINDTGFMFEEEKFTLPKNIGFTKKGVKLLYNAYEVASYADGQIEVVIPYAEVKEILKYKM